jgi:predicted O-linked N-acetylglucosamine transferase (SPINDLY family)
LFAARAAQRQLSWLGYFASTGVAAMDGAPLGADQAPPGSEPYFAEPLSLRNGITTFGCFSNSCG